MKHPSLEKSRSKILLAASIAGDTFLYLTAPDGAFAVLINNLKFNQNSSYTRVFIWNYLWEHILRNLIFGRESITTTLTLWMKETIDNFWF